MGGGRWDVSVVVCCVVAGGAVLEERMDNMVDTSPRRAVSSVWVTSKAFCRDSWTCCWVAMKELMSFTSVSIVVICERVGCIIADTWGATMADRQSRNSSESIYFLKVTRPPLLKVVERPGLDSDVEVFWVPTDELRDVVRELVCDI